jgi:hypothetical protein
MQTPSRSSLHRSPRSRHSFPSTRRSWSARSRQRRPTRSPSCCCRDSSTGCANGAIPRPTKSIGASNDARQRSPATTTKTPPPTVNSSEPRGALIGARAPAVRRRTRCSSRRRRCPGGYRRQGSPAGAHRPSPARGRRRSPLAVEKACDVPVVVDLDVLRLALKRDVSPAQELMTGAPAAVAGEVRGHPRRPTAPKLESGLSGRRRESQAPPGHPRGEPARAHPSPEAAWLSQIADRKAAEKAHTGFEPVPPP